MQIQGCVAFVTGANRGIGIANVKARLEAGANTVYAAAHGPSSLVAASGIFRVKLDATKAHDITAA